MTERHDSDDSIDQIKPFITASINEPALRSKPIRSASQPTPKTIHKHDSMDKKVFLKAKPSTSYHKLKETATNVKNMTAKDKKIPSKCDSKCKTSQSAANRNHHHYKHFISHYNSEKQPKSSQQNYFNSQLQNQGLNISMDFRVETNENGEKTILEEKSNLFLYLDLHGHGLLLN